MQLTLGNVISLATGFAGRTDFTTSEVSLLANLALTEIQNRLPYKSKEAFAFSNLTGAGDEGRVAVPDDFEAVLGITYYSTSTDSSGANVLGDATDLPIVGPELVDSLSRTSGLPQRYTVFGGFIELDPIPNSRGSLVMRYLAKEVTLVQVTETPSLDERWHQGWLWKTTEFVHLARGNAAGAADAERKYLNYMTSTPNDQQQVQSAKFGQGLWVRRS